MATRAIAEGELLFAVPRNRLFTLDTSKLATEHGGDRLRAQFGEWTALMLAMMAEDGDKDSPFRIYLDSLPRDFDTPIFWTDAELRELQASSVLSRIGRAEVDEQYAVAVRPWIELHAASFGHADTSLQAFHRMGSIIQSYAFDIERLRGDPGSEVDESVHEDDELANSEDDEDDSELQKALIPLADLLNGDPVKNNARLFHGKRFEMRAMVAIACGSQIWNTYGDLPDSDLLRRYGYTRGAVTNQDNVVDIPGDLVTDVVQASRDVDRLDPAELHRRIDYLLDQGILDDSFEIDAHHSVVPAEMLIAIEVILLSRSEFRALSRAGQLTDGTQTHEIRDLVMSILHRRLEQYATSLEEDNAILAAPGGGSRMRNAFQVRMGEKAILQRSLEKVHAWRIVRRTSDHNPTVAKKRRR